MRGLNLAVQAMKARLTPASSTPAHVVVGILKGAHTDVDEGALESSVPIAPYAAMMEFGTSRTPPRPFLRQTFAKRQSEWKKGACQLVEDYGLRDPRQILDRLGDTMARDVTAEIRSGDFAPDAPATIAAKERKGRPHPDAPLRDTESMINAVRYEVRNK